MRVLTPLRERNLEAIPVDQYPDKKRYRRETVLSARVDPDKKRYRRETVLSAGVDPDKKRYRRETVLSARVDPDKKRYRRETVMSARVDPDKKRYRRETVLSAGVDPDKKRYRRETVLSAAVDLDKITLLIVTCTDCPDPAICTDRPLPIPGRITDSQTDIPVKIVLSPEAGTNKSLEDNDADMGVVMKFSEGMEDRLYQGLSLWSGRDNYHRLERS